MIVFAVLAALGVSLYITSLFISPALAQRFFIKPITVSSLPSPNKDNDRLVIPKLGIDIAYSSSASMVKEHAQWRDTDLGNPEDGGTMILMAHRLDLQSTPQQTVIHSPFYSLSTLTNGDKLIVDYQGTRYAYEVTRVHTDTISNTPIPTDESDSRLVLSTYDSDDDTTRTVVIAKPLGKVAL